MVLCHYITSYALRVDRALEQNYGWVSAFRISLFEDTRIKN